MHARVAAINRFWANLSLRTKAIALLILPLPILLAGAIGMYRAALGERQARVWVQHTLDVRQNVQDIEVRLLDADASARDFLLTDEQSALRSYSESKELVETLLARLNALVQDNPPQVQRAAEISALVHDEAAALSIIFRDRALRHSASTTRIGNPRPPDGDRDLSSRVRAKLAALQMREDALLQIRSQDAQEARFRLFAILIESVIVGIFFQMIAVLLLSGTISRQIRALEANARLLSQGLPPLPVTADTREVQDLENGFREAAARLASHEYDLMQSQQRFHTLFKEAPIAYHEIDQDGIIRHANHAECLLLGYKNEELVGKHPWQFVAPDSREVVRGNIVDRLNEVRPTAPYECDFECQDQSQITVELHENLIRDKENKVIGIRTALLDVTARKMVGMAVKKVEQYAQELRTKNEELLLALGAARQASATKGRFLAAMSHELRTPLNGIIGLTELMHDGVVGHVSDEHREYLGDILASSKHLLQLVNDVLDMAKIESGRMEFRSEPVEVGPLLGEVRDVLRILADKKNLSMTIDNGTVHSVITDPARLKQVVYNYLSNAIKFAADGGVIQIRTRWEDGTGFRIEVEDDGPGIKPADIPRLFADFQQLDSDRPNLGSGLGLALTKRIVEGQGGTVGVRSAPGVGSVFFAVLPVRIGSEGDGGQEQLPRSAVSGELPSQRVLSLRMPAHV
jgi:PAS domain S-box-containing protein